MRELRFGRLGAARGQARSLVVFLHGYGANGADLLGLADVLGAHLPGTAFVAPDAPEPCTVAPGMRQWFSIPSYDGTSEETARAGLMAAARDLDAFLDARLAEEGIGPQALALFGFSQGAMMSLHVALRRAEAIAGVIACSGRLLLPEALAAEARAKPPVLLMHGDQDAVVPFGDMARAERGLAAAGIAVSGHVMRGSGHGISPDGLGAALAFLKDRLPG